MKIPALLFLSATVCAQGAFDPAASPFAKKPCDSYANYKDESGKPATLLWGSAPFEDFGSRSVTFDPAGVRKLRQTPAPGVHPRIFFGPDDLPDVRKRLRESRCGREAWKNILSWTEMMKGLYDDTQDYAKPDRWLGGFGGLRGRVPLFRLGIQRESGKPGYNKNALAAATYQSLVDGSAKDFPPFYWNTLALESFRCLIDQDSPAAKTAAKAAITLLKIDQAKRAADPKPQGKTPAQPVGAFQLAFIYDFLFNVLTPEQRKLIHDELALGTWSHDNYGTFNTAESSRSNWATFSYWLFEVLAIEGEPGFNDLKVRGMYRGWRNLLTYGWFQSGATFEGEAKNQLGMDGVIAFASRQASYGFENLSGHPYLQAYARNFLPHSVNPMLTGFHKYDLLGGSRASGAGFAPMDMIGLKYMFPKDKNIDWIFRKAVGEDYENVPDRPDGYFNALLFFSIFSTDYDAGDADPAKLGLGNTFFCGERALMMTRSSWDKDAMMLNMHTRQANGGHPFSDRNALMVAGAGRVWSPNGYASFHTAENSTVCIDGLSQNEIVPGRCVDFVDAAQASFMVGDVKYTWDWDWKRLEKNGGYYTLADVQSDKVAIPPGWQPVINSVNDFAFTKLKYAYLDWPQFSYAHWILPKGALSPYVRQPKLPVSKAFRSAGLVRGSQPYAVVVDDIRVDDSVHHYDWTLALESDIQIASVAKQSDGTLDVILTGSDPDQKTPRAKTPLPSAMDAGAAIPNGQPMLLVKVLNRTLDPSKPAAAPEILELPNLADPKKYSPIRRLVIPADAVAPDFKVILVAFHQGQVPPAIAWDARKSVATVNAAGMKDTIAFAPAISGKTDVTIRRSTGAGAGTEIIRVDRAIAPLADDLLEKRAKEEAQTRAWVRGELAGFKPEKLAGLVGHWGFETPVAGIAGTLVPGKNGKALQCDGSANGFALPVELSTFAPAGFTVAFWAKNPDRNNGYFFSNNANRGLGLGIENQALRVDADFQYRWRKIPAALNDWTHLAWTYDGKTMRLYVNGKEAASGESTKTPEFSKQTDLARGFAGALDELLVYQRALTADEIAKIVAVQTYGSNSSKP